MRLHGSGLGQNVQFMNSSLWLTGGSEKALVQAFARGERHGDVCFAC